MTVPGLPSRHFNCSSVTTKLDVICNNEFGIDIQCRPFELNVCTVSAAEQEILCRDGYAQEFFREVPCYCDDRCLSKVGSTWAGSFLGAALIISLTCVVLRRCLKAVSDEEIEERLSVVREDKPDPRVSRLSLNCSKWIPIVTSVAISVWFIVSTGLVIAMNGNPKVSAFEVSYMIISTSFMLFWLLSYITLFVNGASGLYRLKRELANKDPVVHTDSVHHIVIVPNYKEETGVILSTILRLANQKYVNVKKNVTIVLAMEQGEEGYLEKGTLLRDKFLPHFNDVVVTCHPSLAGEQPGKSSNMKWAYSALKRFVTSGYERSSRVSIDKENMVKGESPLYVLEKAVNYAEEPEKIFKHPDLITHTIASPEFAFDPERTVVTLMDADALSHPRFLATLGKKFEETSGATKHLRFWQCPVAFYQNLHELDFLNRAVTTIFAFNELANTGGVDLGLVGSNPRMPVNTYSMSWRLFDLIEGGDNFVVADESHNLFKAFHLTKGLVRLDPIFLPISVYNVASDNFLTGFKSRFVQIKRWMYGNAFEFSFWFSRYIGCARSPNWNVPLLYKLPVLWRLFIYSSVNLVQPLFFCLYGLSWAFYLNSPYFQTLSTILITFIMTIFMMINVSIFIMHWFLINELEIKAIQKWPTWKKICVTLFDAIIGVGAATIFFVFFAGLVASCQLLFYEGLKWGTEGRTKDRLNQERNEIDSIHTKHASSPDDSYHSDVSYANWPEKPNLVSYISKKTSPQYVQLINEP